MLRFPNHVRVILASASPRRAEVLRDAGIQFEVLATDTEERQRSGESAEAMVRRLGEAKARAAVVRLSANHGEGTTIVIGADTVVEIAGAVLGKPSSAENAREMLERLNGRIHHVHTGIALIRVPDGTSRIAVESTAVKFAKLSADEIEEYVATGEPLDKAGAYGIQGLGGRFVERIDGCYFNVVGLPLARVYRMLSELADQP